MRILCVYYQTQPLLRETTNAHLRSFERYAVGCEVFYFNVALGAPPRLLDLPWDVVVYHYTFLAVKWDDLAFRTVRWALRHYDEVRGKREFGAFGNPEAIS